MCPGTVISTVVGYMFSSGMTFMSLGESAAFSRQMYSLLISVLPWIVAVFLFSRG